MNEVVNTQAGLKAFKLNQSASGHFDFDLSVIEEKIRQRLFHTKDPQDCSRVKRPFFS